MSCWKINGIPFWAYTRSEARALAKRQFGCKGCLPKGTPIIKVKP